MKPVKNFREKLNEQEFWVDGALFKIQLPMIGAEDLLWIMPQNIQHNWKVYIKFNWDKEEYFVSRAAVSGSKTEGIALGSFDRDSVVTRDAFVLDFLYGLTKSLLNDKHFD
jgi:hypothetical protein